ncbi:MAG TPA: hypothetical protein VD837_08420 [Terriglobales bacterium]|nr:hypothetical protein [Terriglobales bacterium]
MAHPEKHNNSEEQASGPEAENNNAGPGRNPELGIAADPTAHATNEEIGQDPTEGLHTVGLIDKPRGALGKTDVNLGQDTPVGGGEASGRNVETSEKDEAA